MALLETPCFTFLRLQLLEPRKHPSLLRALYGLLMLLPQCNAFRMLNTRLQAGRMAARGCLGCVCVQR